MRGRRGRRGRDEGCGGRRRLHAGGGHDSSTILKNRHLMFDCISSWKCNFPLTHHVRLCVGWMFGRSVCHDFLKGAKSCTFMLLSEHLFVRQAAARVS